MHIILCLDKLPTHGVLSFLPSTKLKISYLLSFQLPEVGCYLPMVLVAKNSYKLQVPVQSIETKSSCVNFEQQQQKKNSAKKSLSNVESVITLMIK